MSKRPSESLLRRFVVESNRIEGEPTTKGHPLFDDHLELAKMVAGRAWEAHVAGASHAGVMIASSMHRVLMRSQPEKFPGEYRQLRVSVGGHEKMRPVGVRQAMQRLMLEVVRAREAAVPTEEQIWRWHYEFERIHPFVDGNGRVGRLWTNAILVASGYDWHVTTYDERFAYYDRIAAYEHEIAAD